MHDCIHAKRADCNGVDQRLRGLELRGVCENLARLTEHRCEDLAPCMGQFEFILAVLSQK
jgi:hypothetical protein